MQKPRKLTPGQMFKRRFKRRLPPKLRMVARGWTQPDEKSLKKLFDARYVKIGKQISRKLSAELPMNEAIEKFKKEQGTRDIRVARMGRTAIKYALDAAGVSNEKTRKEVHKLMGFFERAVVRDGRNVDNTFDGIASEFIEILGWTKAQIFFNRYFQNIRKMGKFEI